jgi:hypothetical protein
VLSEADDYVAQLRQATGAPLGAATPDVLAWLKERDDCADVICLTAVYKPLISRLEEQTGWEKTHNLRASLSAATIAFLGPEPSVAEPTASRSIDDSDQPAATSTSNLGSGEARESETPPVSNLYGVVGVLVLFAIALLVWRVLKAIPSSLRDELTDNSNSRPRSSPDSAPAHRRESPQTPKNSSPERIIVTAVQRGSFVTAYDQKNRAVFSAPCDQINGVAGYTASTFSVRKAGWINTYNMKGGLIASHQG